MDYGKKFTAKLTLIILSSLVVTSGLIVGAWVLLADIFATDRGLQLLSFVLVSIVLIGLISLITSRIIYKPVKALSDAIVFTGHKSGGTAPKTDKLFLGKELITSLSTQVYDLASMSDDASTATTASSQTQTSNQSSSQTTADAMKAVTPNALNKVASPIFGVDNKQVVRAANKSALDYLGKSEEEVVGKPLFDVANMTFDSEDTFESWLKKMQETVVNGITRWERVRINDFEGKPLKQFDLTASFNKQEEEGVIETMIVFFDRSEQYAKDDREISFVALAVHELRTPLTIMKGYIEVFQDEVAPTLSPEMVGFMHKMQASAQQLTSFVGNILNVARVEDNQLTLTLQKQDWSQILKAAVEDLELRAQVHNIHIELNVADNIPPVAADRISIHEVINNLVDNAIKYSGDSDKIVITSTVNKDGMIETSVQDFGIGIPDSVVPELFQKFYRSHRSKVQVKGTGLGLYLCKAMVNAHGGNIWVHTKEGQGSIFSFTIQSFDQANTDNTGQDGIERGAHGWIKNHTMNRQ